MKWFPFKSFYFQIVDVFFFLIINCNWLTGSRFIQFDMWMWKQHLVLWIPINDSWFSSRCSDFWSVYCKSSMARIKPQALLQQSKKKKGPSRISVATTVIYGIVVVGMVLFIFATCRYWSKRFAILFSLFLNSVSSVPLAL